MSPTTEKTHQRVNEFIEACKKAGIKATHQRIEIFRELVNSRQHPDADAVYQEVKRRIPTISLDTVYRTLRTLEECGMVEPVRTRDASMRYDANPEPHHHFYCTRCGKVTDVYPEDFNELSMQIKPQKFGNVNSVYVELRGVCKECSGWE
jgi:Fur family transcriptional regulator, peroxide stress response regulator